MKKPKSQYLSRKVLRAFAKEMRQEKDLDKIVSFLRKFGAINRHFGSNYTYNLMLYKGYRSPCNTNSKRRA